jgi:EAL domain-containing protein (putative c-di-GMP-specific phosphodiesterase class I)
MYMSKTGGRGRFTVFEPAMHAEVVDRLALEADLQRAMDLDQFFLEYQPIVSIETGDILSFEALLRWNHPTRGLLAPLLVIPIAETTGLIIELGRWILNVACMEACALQRRHPRTPTLSLSVNLSGRQIGHPDIVQHVSDALAASGLPPASLVLEITESVLVHNEPEVLERLWALKRLGCRLAIDDFGTGYSSLAYLQKFPVDILKIDKSFTDRLGAGAQESPIARAVVALGNTISLETVAEGIETREQWERLRELGCERGQGFYFARPGSGDMLDDLLAAEDDAAGRLPAASA